MLVGSGAWPPDRGWVKADVNSWRADSPPKATRLSSLMERLLMVAKMSKG